MKRKQIVITGYYDKKNVGDNIFHYMAVKYFATNVNYEIKLVPSDKLEKYKISIASSTDYIILFGGETLNEYFLKPISEIKQLNQEIKIYGFGLNVGQNIDEIRQYLLMFQYIVCRHVNDINLFNERLPIIKCAHMDDIAFAYDMKGYRKTLNGNAIGFFLSQPKYYSLNEQQQSLYIDKIIKLIKECVSLKHDIKLFSMCYNDIISESDILLNNTILQNLDNDIRNKVSIVNNDNFYDEILYVKYAICERFHAHVLVLIYNIPFVSLANTSKVKYLLAENGLSEYLFDDINHTSILSKLKQTDKCRLKKIYKAISKKVNHFYNNLPQVDVDDIFPEYDKHKIRPYICSKLIKQYCDTIHDNVCSNINNLSAESNCDYILMSIFGQNNNEFRWGIENKLRDNKFIYDDIRWLFDQSITNYSYLFCKIIELLPQYKYDPYINIDYIDQYDRTGAHRCGWKYVTDYLSYGMSSFNQSDPICDLYIDRTFHWNGIIMKNAGIIPYKRPWIGFIHHTLFQDEGGYNCIQLFKSNDFIISLLACDGLFVLSNYLKEQLIQLAALQNIKLPPVYTLYHPTCFVPANKHWQYSRWKGKIIQIGSWMRDLSAIYRLKYKKKYALVGKSMEHKYISCSSSTDNKTYDKFKYTQYPVTLIDNLDNDKYDDMLTKYIVLLQLYDASAVNTIIECIVRNTPIFVNKLPAVVEYLGEKYPLYYDDINNVPTMINNNKLIRQAHCYLKNMNKDFLKIETFVGNMKQIRQYLPTHV